jgi:hypothetical protein
MKTTTKQTTKPLFWKRTRNRSETRTWKFEHKADMDKGREADDYTDINTTTNTVTETQRRPKETWTQTRNGHGHGH